MRMLGTCSCLNCQNAFGTFGVPITLAIVEMDPTAVRSDRKRNVLVDRATRSRKLDGVKEG
jgi:hypothetical protein